MSDTTATAAGQIVVGMYAFHTPDPLRLATFWGELMDLPLADGASSDLAMLNFDHDHGPITWLFQKGPGDGAPGGRLGLDLGTDAADWQAPADRAEALGAWRGEERELNGARWIELRDPDGNPFRVFAPRPQ
jgi:hypothetical protein